MVNVTESNEDNKKEAEKDSNEAVSVLWLLALSPLAMLLLGMGSNSNTLFLILYWSATVGIIVPCVLIYLFGQRHFAATNAAALVLLVNIGIAFVAFGILSGGA